MKAIIATQPGGSDVLEIKDVEDVQPQENEVKLKVLAFGLNKAEAYNRMGKHGAFSGKFALGIEAVGEVVLDPSGKLKPGHRVVTAMGGMMFSRHGSYAEYICVKQSNIIPIDSRLDHVSLATLPEAYLTAWGALVHNLDLQAGETLLVRGGTTSVGMASIALAKWMGAKVFATTRQLKRTETLQNLGADLVFVDNGDINERVREHLPKGVDKAIELVGATTLKDTLKAVRKWGEVAFVGFVGGTPIVEHFHMMNDMPNTVKLSFFGSGLLGSEDLPVDQAPINQIADAIYSGALPSILLRAFEFEDIQNAHDFLESNQALGKIVLTAP